jgi:hypothetical protein
MSACSRRVLPYLPKLLALAALGALSLLATLPLSAQTESTAHSFTDGYDGGYPFAGLIQGWDGVLRGGTSQGGASLTSGGPSYGTYFSYDLYPGDPFAFTSVYSFCPDAQFLDHHRLQSVRTVAPGRRWQLLRHHQTRRRQ